MVNKELASTKRIYIVKRTAAFVFHAGAARAIERKWRPPDAAMS